MPVEVNNLTKVEIDLKLVKEVTEIFLKKYKQRQKEVSLAFVGDKRIKDLNRIYRKKDKVTDVLSFNGEGDFLGEIIINPLQIKRQAKEYKRSVKEELIFILVHGLLHLIGYNDETEKERLGMIKKGEEFINKLNPKS